MAHVNFTKDILKKRSRFPLATARRHGVVLFHLKYVNWTFLTTYVTTTRSLQLHSTADANLMAKPPFQKWRPPRPPPQLPK